MPMATETILLIEDERNIAELVKYNLDREGFHVICVSSGRAGLEAAQKNPPTLILLDLMLPELGGLEICKILKENPKTRAIPVIMLTAKSTEADKVLGLELGADDYITKPFSPRELLARIKAVLRRINTSPEREILEAGSIELDLGKHELRVKEKPVEITAKEFALLEAMMASKGRVLTRETLLGKVWGYENSTRLETRTVDMHITQLRKKLKNEAPRIVTLKGVGYRFDGD
ncbi:MAG: Alkaline phosphatase synthesis transcriptional regulatory protein PhoP [Candidatus Omnitrophica bacterium ADurb.Bin292]|nr:MAG: Alkaline phosphatase synthesis transcriptional regulatory protein PhoP [Candidatus Omnitrophica bacterium ADurb.Bin292]